MTDGISVKFVISLDEALKLFLCMSAHSDCEFALCHTWCKTWKVCRHRETGLVCLLACFFFVLFCFIFVWMELTVISRVGREQSMCATVMNRCDIVEERDFSWFQVNCFLLSISTRVAFSKCLCSLDMLP